MTARNGMLAAGATLAVAVALSSAPVRAEDFAGDVPDRVWVDLGGSTNDLATDVAVTGEAGVGTSINFEDVFDLPGSKTTFRLLGTVRVSERRRWVDFGYVNIDRSGGHIIQEDITYGDYVFQSGGRVDASFGTEFIYGAFRYDFLHVDKVRISGSAGLSYTKLDATLTGHGNVVGPDGPIAGTFEKSESLNAPVPLVGLNLDWAITKRLTLRSYNRLFRIKVSDIDGGMYESGLHLNYYFIRNFGLGLGVDRNQVKVNEATLSDDTTGRFNYVVTGVGLYAALAF